MEEIVLCQPIKKKSTHCIFENCYKRASFNFECEKTRLYCCSHRLDGMVNKVHKTCIYPNCKKRPSYNIEGKKIGLYCVNHKLNGMVDTVNKICIFENCRTIPNFNFKQENTGLYCFKHKLNDMINVIDNICLYSKCHKRPNYNIEGEKRGLYCVNHKLDGMINVVSKLCIYLNCKKLPSYNIKGIKNPIYCAEHKLDNMNPVKFTKRCFYVNCNKIPVYNLKGKTIGIYCLQHKTENMINVKDKTCKTELCDTQVTSKYQGYCLRCFIHLFPNKPVCHNYKTKESATAQFITNNFPNFTWNLDKKIEDGCSKRRPDLMCDLGYQVIIVEVDENQHTNYDCSCENKRIMQLSQDVGHRAIIFIRFNPDDYVNSSGEKITSCWAITPKTGLLKIKNNKNDEWLKRLDILKGTIEYWSNPENKTEKTLEVIQLFYNQNA